VRRFNATHPDIEATFVPGPWSQALLEQLIVQVAGGAAPDVGTLRGVTVGPILESLSVDLTPYIQRDRYPLNWSCLGLVDTVSVTPLTLGFPLVCCGTTEFRSLPG
jgi:hypothetical protein